MTKDTKEIKLVKRYVQKYGAVKLAYLLGYRHSTVIDGWIKTQSIPSYQVSKVLEILKQEKESAA